MRSKALTFLLCLVAGLAAAQSSFTKKDIEKAFRASVSKNESENSVWMACNADSSYFNADTIKLYNHQYYYYHSSCCSYVNWHFSNKRSFSLTQSLMCQESRLWELPPGEIIIRPG